MSVSNDRSFTYVTFALNYFRFEQFLPSFLYRASKYTSHSTSSGKTSSGEYRVFAKAVESKSLDSWTYSWLVFADFEKRLIGLLSFRLNDKRIASEITCAGAGEIRESKGSPKGSESSMGFPFATPRVMPRMILNGGIVPLTSNRSLDVHSIVMTSARFACHFRGYPFTVPVYENALI